MDLISGYSSSSDDDVSAVTISALPTRRNSTSNAFEHLMARAKSTKNMLTSNVPKRKDSQLSRAEMPTNSEGSTTRHHDSENEEEDSEKSDSDDCLSEGGAQISEPELALIEQSRKLKQKRQTKSGTHRGGGKRISKEPKVSAAQRVDEFPDEGFIALSGNRLFCNGCKDTISLIRSRCVSHTKSEKHKAKKAARIAALSRNAELKDDLIAYFTANPAEQGASIRPEVHVDRFNITRAFSAAAIPIIKLDILRPTLEKHGHLSLTDSSHLRQYIPKIESQELATIEFEIKDDDGSLTLDGTRRNGEAIAGVFRSCKNFELLHRLVLFKTTAKNIRGVELAAIVTNLYMLTLKKNVESLTATSRDACSVNHAASQSLTSTFVNAEDLICICHTLSCTGDELAFDVLNEFMTSWLTLVQNSPAAKAEWKSIVGEGMKGFSNIRWHSKAEIVVEIGKNFGSVPSFLLTLLELGIGDATTNKMIGIYERDPLLLELSVAAYMDIELLISTTYEMEGERLEILLVYSRVERLRELGRRIKSRGRGVLVNVEAVIRRMQNFPAIGMVFTKDFERHGVFEGRIISIDTDEDDGSKVYRVVYNDDDEEDIDEEGIKELLKSHGEYAFGKIVDSMVPAFDYLDNRLTGNCKTMFSCQHTYEVFRLARIFDPSFVSDNEAAIDNAFVSNLAAIKPLARDGGDLIRELQRDLHLYIAESRGFVVDHGDVGTFTTSVLAWWKNHGKSTGAWRRAAEIVFSLTPNSASAERVFSLLKSMFGDNQEHCLADLVQSSIMLRYNKREP